MIRLLLFIALIAHNFAIQAQNTLTVSLPQATDSTLIILARHQFEKMRRVDSGWVHLNKTTITLNPGNEMGLYSIIPKGKAPIPVTVVESKSFQIEILFDTSGQSIVKFEGSEQNTTYHTYITAIKPYSNRLTALRTQYDWFRKMGMSDRTAYDDLNKEVALTQDSLRMVQESALAAHPDHFWAKMLKTLAPPALPATLSENANKTGGKEAIQAYMREHYWDSYDFTDRRLIYTAIFQNKLDQWLGMHLVQIDTLLRAVDRVLTQVNNYPEYRNHTLTYIITKFEQPDIFDGDKVIVHVADKYYLKPGDGGTDIASFERIKYKADAFRPALNGLKAPAIELPDSTGKLRSLHEVNAEYTVLYFYSPMCDKCKEVTPKVFQYMQVYPPEKVQVYAVTLDDQPDKWREFTRQMPGWTCVHSTANPHPIEKQYVHPGLPAIYLLDKDKKIIAKRFTAEKLAEFLGQLTSGK